MILALLVLGCATVQTPPPAALAPVIVAPLPPAPPGSLWSDVGSRELAGMDNNARRVGDLITVQIIEESSTTIGANTSTGRASESEFGITSMLGVDTSILKANPNMGSSIGLGGGSSSSTTGTGTTSRSGSVKATVQCVVVEVLPNGNLRVSGSKNIAVNNEVQTIAIIGTVRPRDVGLDNTVASTMLADQWVSFNGRGQLANQQGQSWGAAVANVLWPF